MCSNRFRPFAATVAGLAISLSFSACGIQPSASTESPSPSAASSPASEPAFSATAPPPSATATPAAETPASPVKSDPATPSAVPSVSAVPPEPTQAPLKSFTFPDGHISFSYPAGWSVRTQRGPGSDGPPWQPLEAIVSDATGDDLASISSGANGIGCTAGPVTRTVLDRAPVPGLRETDGTTPHFGFDVESTGGTDYYSMEVSNPRFLQEGEGVASGCSLLIMGNGGAQTRTIFGEPAFPSRDAAKAWMGTEQYAQLKALMLSLTYS
jgi:hypothetical protein